ncbi:hypothetical protein WAF17_20555 [Bernardetia sp. ABR2-2B]|uniref:hypothetical protein n=1 Tax=Bernardetia sp. ABR2-2B TaxID=3127472 RepID=UPI0030CC4F7D
MNTKISVFLFALLLSSTTLFSSCSPSERKDAQAEVNEEMTEMNNEITEAGNEFEQKRMDWKNEWQNKTDMWDTRLEKLDTKIETLGDAASAEMIQEREELRNEYAEFKTKMENTENITEAEWAEFKADINQRGEKIATDVDNFLKNIDVNGDGK